MAQNLPYPVIFLHGFVSSHTTWDDMKNNLQNTYGFSYGGNMNFCLNQDNNTATSNATTDYKDWTNMSLLSAGDFYTVNFDTDPAGNTITNTAVSEALESNQAGLVKQGLAVRDAIKHVLQVTGKSKVILCGHSMGGLASREYLQNQALWQADGMHHVAKLTTLGTPHGGTNLTGAGLGGLAGLDEYSEGVRDMRTSYFWSGEPGVYLFGGKEKYNVMQYYPFFDYVNVDVNCNGIDADGSTIIGLNQKNIPADIAYSCTIGNASGSGDYVVTAVSANLNNFRPASADTFIVNAGHTSLTSQIEVNIKALDEPKTAATAYTIFPNEFYSGLFTKQSTTASAATDSDYYKFTMPAAGNIRAEISNMPLQNGVVRFYDQTNALQFSTTTNAAGYADITSPVLPAGNYFLNIAGVPEAGADAFPYSLRLSFLQLVALPAVSFNVEAAPERRARINWNAPDENGIAGYELERSADGINWKKMCLVTTLINNYTLFDDEPLRKNYYRLKIKAPSGTFEYSSVKKVSFDTDVLFAFSVSPNPAKDFTVLHFNRSLKEAIVVVSNMQGRILLEQKTSGTGTVLNVSAFAAGVYSVRVITTDGRAQNKMFTIK